MARRKIDMVGKRFDKLLVVELFEKTPYGNLLWLCRCDCGNTLIRDGSNLRRSANGFTGCKQCEKETRSQSQIIHGGCGTRLHKIWENIKARCYCPTKDNYVWYGGKGIKVCDEWLNFDKFRTWALSHGYNDRLTIERKNPLLDYSPDNCEWITQSENSKRARKYNRISKVTN